MIKDFEKIRNEYSWTYYGKRHNETPKTKKLSELSDSHILHIIPWLKHQANKEEDLKLFYQEQEYRSLNYIFVTEDY